MKPLNPTDYPTYNVGDKVTIRQWDDMESEFGLDESINDKYWIYMLDCCYFPFTEDMFVFTSPAPASTISFDDLIKGAT